MAVVASTAIAVPDHCYTCDDAKRYLERAFRVPPRLLPRVLAMYDHAHVGQRYAVLPLDEAIRPRSLTEINQEYQRHVVRLGLRVAEECLTRAGLSAAAVDFLITVSCTGWMIPSLDAHLINQLGFRRDVRRLPITELGCAGGAAALSRALEFTLAFPGATALVVAVELSSLNVQTRDASMANLVATALFGDGAAAALVTDATTGGAAILDSESYLFPDSCEVLSYDLRDSGLHMVLANSMPHLVGDRIDELVAPLLSRHGLTPEDLTFAILHPGGKKILEAIELALHLPRAATQPSWDILWRYGNLSSATVLFILDEWLRRCERTRGDHGLLAAFGPGFSSELLLMQWV